MASFEQAIPALLRREGGDEVVEDPRDPGGLTKYGISQRAYPHLDIRALSEPEARHIYRTDFWDLIKLGGLQQDVAEPMFDMAVNSGPYRAVLLAQRVAGVDADGRIGPITLRALRSYDPERFRYPYALARIGYYTEVAWKQQRPLSHLVAWVRRALELA